MLKRLSVSAVSVLLLLSFPAAPVHANTLQNLLVIYEEEVNIQTHYIAYAQRAEEEGYRGAAALFRAVAKASEISVKRLLKSIQKLGGFPHIVIESFPVDTTRQNLDTAARVEQFEWKRLYPQFVEEARRENILEPIEAMTWAKTAQNQHAGLFRRAMDSLEEWRADRTFYVCSVCGYSLMGRPGRQCPSCHEVDSFGTVS